jgi:DNA polymerase-1
MLWKLLNEMKPEERPTHLAVVFDKSEKTFRTDFYPQYKAHRPDAPADLIPQFPLIREAVKAFDIPCLEQPGFEADDLIATYARLACEAQATCTIVSSDKDLMQLVNDSVVMYDTMKDKRIGIPEVFDLKRRPWIEPDAIDAMLERRTRMAATLDKLIAKKGKALVVINQ